jgi:hypothetical protein
LTCRNAPSRQAKAQSSTTAIEYSAAAGFANSSVLATPISELDETIANAFAIEVGSTDTPVCARRRNAKAKSALSPLTLGLGRLLDQEKTVRPAASTTSG